MSQQRRRTALSLHRILQDGHAAPSQPMADGERSEILLFKQPQQQVARFAGSTCPATPGCAHQLRGTCTLDPGRASGGVTESEDVPVGAGRALWTLDELPGELRSQKTCPPGRQCGPAWVYEDAWSQHSSYSPAATTPLDEPLQRTSPSAIRWCPQGPGQACSAARRAPGQPDVPAGQPGCTCLGVRRCQHPAPSCSPAAAEDGPLDELQLQTSRQRRQMWGLDSQGVCAEEETSPDEPAVPPDKTSWLGLSGTRDIWSRPAP